MNICEKLQTFLGKDILIEIALTNNKGYHYDIKGKLEEVGSDYIVLNELDEGGENYTGDKIYTLNLVHSITEYHKA